MRRQSCIAYSLLVLSCVDSGAPIAQLDGSPAPTDTSAFGKEYSELVHLRDSAPAAFDSLSATIVFAAQMHLGRLGFGAGPFTGGIDAATLAAVRRFETARGLPETGNPLSRRTLERLFAEQERLERLDRAPRATGSTFGGSMWEEGYVAADGEWRLEPVASAMHDAVKVVCWRDRSTCTIHYARVDPEDGRLFADYEDYAIARWDRSEITSEPLDYPCARYLLRLNRVQESVVLTRTTLSTSRGCEHMSTITLTNRFATFSESYERYQSEWRTAWDSLYALGPQMRAVLQAGRNRAP